MSHIAFDEIQGNVLGGFNKDQQLNILLKIADVAKAKATFAARSPNEEASILDDLTANSSEDVLNFNTQFNALRAQGMKPESVVAATCTNVVFTHAGLSKFGVLGLMEFPAAYKDELFSRAASLGDIGESDPSKWKDLQTPTGTTPLDAQDWSTIDLMIMVASDAPGQTSHMALGYRIASDLSRINAANSGLAIVRLIHGAMRRGNEAGHQHAGFEDGVSQPGVRGVDQPDDPLAAPDQGNCGQDLLQPGEFFLGYLSQLPFGSGADGPNPSSGPIADQEFLPTDPADPRVVLPPRAENGSFLFSRRLCQGFVGFHKFVGQTASGLGIAPELLGAKIVGRYASDALVEKIKVLSNSTTWPWPPMTDPAVPPVLRPALARSDKLNNDFEYNDDEDGDIVPRAAHHRKAYPRDQVATGQNEIDAESQTQTPVFCAGASRSELRSTRRRRPAERPRRHSAGYCSSATSRISSGNSNSSKRAGSTIRTFRSEVTASTRSSTTRLPVDRFPDAHSMRPAIGRRARCRFSIS